MAKRHKESEVPKGQTAGKTSGLQRANSFSTLRNRSADSAGQSKHTRGLSGSRGTKSRSGSTHSSKSEPEKQKTSGMTIPTTPTVMK